MERCIRTRLGPIYPISTHFEGYHEGYNLMASLERYTARLLPGNYLVVSSVKKITQ